MNPADLTSEQQEYLASFRRAFVDHRSESILFDGHEARNKFLRDGLNWAIDQGIIYHDEKSDWLYSDSQWTTLVYRLTDKGHEILGLPKKESKPPAP